ncbi:MAG: hypothetical protein ACPGU9_06750 [Flavobacteriaceae bacterium]
MKTIKNCPVYNRKGQRIISITAQEASYIDDTKVDERFFIVENAFLVIKSKFFRQEHLVKNWTFFIQGTQVHFKKKENLKYKKVLFVLEAPHHNEFDYNDNFKGLKPLEGIFEQFKLTFHKLMDEITSNTALAYEVCLYNPVPFQNSLHYLFRRNIKEKTKLDFWLYGWFDLKYHKEFEEFLGYRKFDYYINASTRTYKTLISRKLSKLINTEYQVYHPNSNFWRRETIKFGLKKIVHLDNSHELFNTNTNTPKEESIF